MQPNLEENKVFIHEFSRTAPVNVLLDHFFFLMNEWPTWRTFRGKVLRKCRMFFLVVISSLKAWYVCFFWKYTKRKQQTNKQTRLVFFFFLFLFFCRYKETTDVFNEITSAKKYSKFLRPFHKGNRQKKCTVTFKCTQSKAKGPAKTRSKYGALSVKKGVYGVEQTNLHSHAGISTLMYISSSEKERKIEDKVITTRNQLKRDVCNKYSLIDFLNVLIFMMFSVIYRKSSKS